MTSKSETNKQNGSSIDWGSVSLQSKRILKALGQPVSLLAIALIAFAGIAGYNFNLSTQQSELDEKVAALNAATAAGVPDIEGASVTLDSAQSKYQIAVENRLLGFSDARLSLSLIELATQFGVTLSVTDTESEGFENIDGQSYPAMPVTLSGRGTIEDIQRFVLSLESGSIAGLEIKNASISSGSEGIYEMTLRGFVYRQLADAEFETESSSGSAD